MADFEDRFAIAEMHQRFAHAVDRFDYAILRSFYTDDAIEEHGAYNGPVDGYIDWLKEIRPGFDIMHHTVSGLVVAIDGDTAESESRGTAFLRMKGSPPHNVITVSRHFDRYRRENGVWKFSFRAICVDWSQPFAPIEGGFDMISAFQTGRPGEDDPVYRHVPNLVRALRAGS